MVALNNFGHLPTPQAVADFILTANETDLIEAVHLAQQMTMTAMSRKRYEMRNIVVLGSMGTAMMAYIVDIGNRAMPATEEFTNFLADFTEKYNAVDGA